MTSRRRPPSDQENVEPPRHHANPLLAQSPVLQSMRYRNPSPGLKSALKRTSIDAFTPGKSLLNSSIGGASRGVGEGPLDKQPLSVFDQSPGDLQPRRKRVSFAREEQNSIKHFIRDDDRSSSSGENAQTESESLTPSSTTPTSTTALLPSSAPSLPVNLSFLQSAAPGSKRPTSASKAAPVAEASPLEVDKGSLAYDTCRIAVGSITKAIKPLGQMSPLSATPKKPPSPRPPRATPQTAQSPSRRALFATGSSTGTGSGASQEAAPAADQAASAAFLQSPARSPRRQATRSGAPDSPSVRRSPRLQAVQERTGEEGQAAMPARSLAEHRRRPIQRKPIARTFADMLPHKDSTSQQAPSATPSSLGLSILGPSQRPTLTAGSAQQAASPGVEDEENAVPHGDSARSPMDAACSTPADMENKASAPTAAAPDPVDKENAPPGQGAQTVDAAQAAHPAVAGPGAVSQEAEQRANTQSGEAGQGSGPQGDGVGRLNMSPLEGDDTEEISPMSLAAQLDTSNTTIDIGKLLRSRSAKKPEQGAEGSGHARVEPAPAYSEPAQPAHRASPRRVQKKQCGMCSEQSPPGSLQKDAPGSACKSAPGSACKSAPGSARKSAPGSACKSAPGSACKSAPGSACKSAPGSSCKSAPRRLQETAPGSAQRAQSSAAKEETVGTDRRGMEVSSQRRSPRSARTALFLQETATPSSSVGLRSAGSDLSRRESKLDQVSPLSLKDLPEFSTSQVEQQHREGGPRGGDAIGSQSARAAPSPGLLLVARASQREGLPSARTMAATSPAASLLSPSSLGTPGVRVLRSGTKAGATGLLISSQRNSPTSARKAPVSKPLAVVSSPVRRSPRIKSAVSKFPIPSPDLETSPWEADACDWLTRDSPTDGLMLGKIPASTSGASFMQNKSPASTPGAQSTSSLAPSEDAEEEEESEDSEEEGEEEEESEEGGGSEEEEEEEDEEAAGGGRREREGAGVQQQAEGEERGRTQVVPGRVNPAVARPSKGTERAEQAHLGTLDLTVDLTQMGGAGLVIDSPVDPTGDIQFLAAMNDQSFGIDFSPPSSGGSVDFTELIDALDDPIDVPGLGLPGVSALGVRVLETSVSGGAHNLCAAAHMLMEQAEGPLLPDGPGSVETRQDRGHAAAQTWLASHTDNVLMVPEAYPGAQEELTVHCTTRGANGIDVRQAGAGAGVGSGVEHEEQGQMGTGCEREAGGNSHESGQMSQGVLKVEAGAGAVEVQTSQKGEHLTKGVPGPEELPVDPAQEFGDTGSPVLGLLLTVAKDSPLQAPAMASQGAVAQVPPPPSESHFKALTGAAGTAGLLTGQPTAKFGDVCKCMDIPTMAFEGGGPASPGPRAWQVTPYTPLTPEKWNLSEQTLHKFCHPTEVSLASKRMELLKRWRQEIGTDEESMDSSAPFFEIAKAAHKMQRQYPGEYKALQEICHSAHEASLRHVQAELLKQRIGQAEDLNATVLSAMEELKTASVESKEKVERAQKLLVMARQLRAAVERREEGGSLEVADGAGLDEEEHMRILRLKVAAAQERLKTKKAIQQQIQGRLEKAKLKAQNPDPAPAPAPAPAVPKPAAKVGQEAVQELLQDRRHTGQWKAQIFLAGVALISDLEGWKVTHVHQEDKTTHLVLSFFRYFKLRLLLFEETKTFKFDIQPNTAALNQVLPDVDVAGGLRGMMLNTTPFLPGTPWTQGLRPLAEQKQLPTTLLYNLFLELKTRALAAEALVRDMRRVILDCGYLKGLTLTESQEEDCGAPCGLVELRMKFLTFLPVLAQAEAVVRMDPSPRGIEYTESIVDAALTIFPHASSSKKASTHSLVVPCGGQEAASGSKAPKTPMHNLCSQVIQLITS